MFLYDVLKSSNRKSCLLCYITDPFVSKKNEDVEHTNYWQSRAIASELDRRGYRVDVIDYLDNSSTLKGVYDCVIDILGGAGVDYNNNIDSHTIKIVYFTGANPTFTNDRVNERKENLYKRRGVRIADLPPTPEFPQKVSEYDAALCIGNAFTLKTYKSLYHRNIYRIRNNGIDYDPPVSRVFRESKNYLFIGSTNQVLKGLDILLDIFLSNDSLDLYICSPVDEERGFYSAYSYALENVKNIHYYGWQNIKGKVFRECLEKCAFLIYPSCSEGCAGSVLTAMSAGVIPIVTEASGFDEDDEVIILKDDDIGSIEDAIIMYSKMEKSWIDDKSIRVMNVQKNKYGRSNFVESISTAFDQIGL